MRKTSRIEAGIVSKTVRKRVTKMHFLFRKRILFQKKKRGTQAYLIFPVASSATEPILTLWSRSRVKKLGSSASQEIPNCMEPERFVTLFITASWFIPALSQMKPVHALPSSTWCLLHVPPWALKNIRQYFHSYVMFWHIQLNQRSKINNNLWIHSSIFTPTFSWFL